MTVNSTAWKSMPIADREQEFDADDAIARLIERAGLGGGGGNIGEFNKAFLYRETKGDPKNRDSYRLPIADVIEGKLVLIPHAVYAAAALLSGAHGGLPNVPDNEKDQIRDIISEIYIKLRDLFNDPRIRPPWDRGQPPERRSDAKMTTQNTSEFNITMVGSEDVAPFRLTFEPISSTSTVGSWEWVSDSEDYDDDDDLDYASNPKEPYGDVPYADPGYQEDGKKRYPLDSEEHCRAAWSYINMPKNAEKYTPDQLAQIKARIKKALKKYGVNISEDEDMAKKKKAADSYSLLASFQVAPSRDWFNDPKLVGPTALTVQADGRVFGHLAQWGICHTGIGNACVSAPKSVTNYGYFKTGEVICDNGESIAIGKITLGAGHASPQWGIKPSQEHYDSSATCAAVVNAGEDQYGIWIAGSLVPDLSEEEAAELRRSPLSGDWRRVSGNLELIAALAVNTPGFPIVRTAEGQQTTLLAAGIIGTDIEPVPEQPAEDKKERFAQLINKIDREQRQKRLSRVMGGV